MENPKDDILMKVRSSRGCIGAGYRLYTGNFKKIFRYTWVAALVYALACSGLGTLMVMQPQRMFAGVVVVLLMEALFVACGYSVLKQHQEDGTIMWTAKWLNLNSHIFTRTLCSLLLILVVYIIASVAIGAASYLALTYLQRYTALAAVALASVITLALLLPMIYVVTKYILRDDCHLLRHIGENYATGLRHWGFLFVVLFVASLVEVLLTMVFSLPAGILSLANMRATQSVLLGDPYGMPTYIAPLTAVTFLLIGFIQAYIQLSVLFPIYYAYGSIDAQEEEKKDFTNNQQ